MAKVAELTPGQLEAERLCVVRMLLGSSVMLRGHLARPELADSLDALRETLEAPITDD